MKLSGIIYKGLILVYGPLLSFVAICGLIGNWYAIHILKLDKDNLIVVLILIIALGIGWFWWSYKIVKWKIRAFSQINLEQAYELYDRAIGVGLIWPTGSIFNKTEIWTEEDKKKWLEINSDIQKIFEI